MPKINRLSLLFFIFSALIVISTCQKTDSSVDSNYFFTGSDLSGQAVRLNKQPQTIISLAPSNTEILYALGLSKKIIGVTNFCNYPIEAKDKEKLGDLMSLNLEKVVRLSPDLILASTQLLPEKRKIIEDAGIAVAITEGTSLAQALDSIILIGQLTGTLEDAKKIVNKMKSEIEEIKNKTQNLSKPSVYYIVSFGQYGNWTCGPGSFIDEMISLAGGQNVAKEVTKPWAEFSLERLVALDPELLLAGKYSGPIENLKNETGYRDLTAVKKNKVIIVDDDLTTRPGPRLIDGLKQIAKAIHPNIFN